jgi:hypothetical protein
MAIKKSALRFSTQNRVVLPGSGKSTLAVAVTEKQLTGLRPDRDGRNVVAR